MCDPLGSLSGWSRSSWKSGVRFVAMAQPFRWYSNALLSPSFSRPRKMIVDWCCIFSNSAPDLTSQLHWHVLLRLVYDACFARSTQKKNINHNRFILIRVLFSIHREGFAVISLLCAGAATGCLKASNRDLLADTGTLCLLPGQTACTAGTSSGRRMDQTHHAFDGW